MHNEPHTREAADFNGRRILVTGGTKGIDSHTITVPKRRNGTEAMADLPKADHSRHTGRSLRLWREVG